MKIITIIKITIIIISNDKKKHNNDSNNKCEVSGEGNTDIT